MMTELLASYAHTLDLIRRTVADIPPESWTAAPANVPNHPAWTIGQEIGVDPWLPDDWGEKYGTGSQPLPSPEAYPGLTELLDHLTDGRRRLENRLRSMDPDILAGPLPDPRYRSTFPTLGHAVFHAGQLMVWRRAMNLPTEPAL